MQDEVQKSATDAHTTIVSSTKLSKFLHMTCLEPRNVFHEPLLIQLDLGLRDLLSDARNNLNIFFFSQERWRNIKRDRGL